MERAELVPVADAVKPRVAVIARVAERRGEHLHVGQQQRHAPDREDALQLAPRGPLEPRADQRHDQIKSYQHIEIPERRGVVAEVEDEGPHFVQRRFAGEQRGVDRRAGGPDVAHIHHWKDGWPLPIAV